jgi:hypothetical protein
MIGDGGTDTGDRVQRWFIAGIFISPLLVLVVTRWNQLAFYLLWWSRPYPAEGMVVLVGLGVALTIWLSRGLGLIGLTVGCIVLAAMLAGVVLYLDEGFLERVILRL